MTLIKQKSPKQKIVQWGTSQVYPSTLVQYLSYQSPMSSALPRTWVITNCTRIVDAFLVSAIAYFIKMKKNKLA